MPFRINPKTGEKEWIDAATGQPIQAGQGMSTQTADFQPAEKVVEPKRSGLFGNIQDMAGGFAKTFFPATKNYVKDVGQLGAIKTKSFDKAQDSINKSQDGVAKLRKMAREAKDPKRKKRLLAAAKQVQELTDSARADATPDFSEDIDKNPLERGLAVGAEVAPLALTAKARGATALARTASMAKQGALLSGTRTATSLEEMTPAERAARTAKDAAIGGVILGGVQGGGEVIRKAASATSKAGSKTTQAGTAVRQHARKIEEPAGVWGADKEEAINATLDKVGLKGSASKQYKGLSDKYGELTKRIQNHFNKKSVTVKGDDVAEAVTSKLDDIPGDVLSEKQGYAEWNRVIKEADKVTDSASLFKMKQWLNGRLGRVYTKIEKGTPLSAAEEVTLASRDSIDDLIKTLHPEVKDLTVMQSHLRDAAPSLNRARKLTPTTRLAGTTVPQGVISKSQDVAGRVLQGAGKVVEKAGNAEQAALSFAQPATKAAGQVATKAAPILATPLGRESVQDTQNNAANNDNSQIQQNNTNNQANHGLSVPQTGEVASTPQSTVTGYTTTQLRQALVAAVGANAKSATKQLEKMLEIEEAHEEATGGGGGADLNVSKVTAQNYTNAKSGASSLNEALSLIFNEKGDLERWTVGASNIPGGKLVNQKARQLDALMFNVADSYLRIRTGAQANETEIKKLADALAPKTTDTAETVKTRLNNYIFAFDEILNLANQKDLTDEPVQGLQFSGGQRAF